LALQASDGRVFHGTMDWANKKGNGKEDFSGVIDKDGVTFYGLVPGGANPRAEFAEFKRGK